MLLACGRYQLDVSQPRIMAIINVTPDSFSGDGLAHDRAAAVAHAEAAIEAGADLLDIGGESTRPGAEPVSEAEELERVIPMLEALRDCGVPLSVDTMKPAVMRAAIEAGADMVNDVNAFQAAGAIDAVAQSAAALCVMHMQGAPRTMQSSPEYQDVVTEVADFLHARVECLRAAGVGDERIVLDPGFGFGKRLDHNLALLRHLKRFSRDGLTLLAGLSRKSMLGAITGRPQGERLAASVAAALIAVQHGAQLVRVHDVAATRDALRVWAAVTEEVGCDHP